MGDISPVLQEIGSHDEVDVEVITSPCNCLIGGSYQSCRQIARSFPDLTPHSIEFDYAIHTRHAMMASEQIAHLCGIPHATKIDVRMDSLYAGRAVDLERDDVGQFLYQQMINPIDAQKHFERVWDDGVRVFVEMGYRGWLTRSIKDTLKGRPHLAVATNRFGFSPVYQLALAAGELYAHGVESDLGALVRHSDPDHAG